MLFDRMDGANCRNGSEAEADARFAQKAFESLAVPLIFFGYKFQGDAASELGVFRFVDDTHAAGPEFSENPVVGEGFVNHDGSARGMLNGQRNSVNAH